MYALSMARSFNKHDDITVSIYPEKEFTMVNGIENAGILKTKN